MNEKKCIILMIFSTLFILVGGIFFLTTSYSPAQVSTSKNVTAYVADPTSFDWGNIPMKEGNVTKTFSIKNTGTDVLKLFNVKTSCHCTVANVTINGETSQNFGMSGVFSWVGEVAPGKVSKLTVIFDPAFHGPQGVGPINRFVSVETNDKENQKLTFTLTGTVVK